MQTAFGHRQIRSLEICSARRLSIWRPANLQVRSRDRGQCSYVLSGNVIGCVNRHQSKHSVKESRSENRLTTKARVENLEPGCCIQDHGAQPRHVQPIPSHKISLATHLVVSEVRPVLQPSSRVSGIRWWKTAMRG